jgi:plastocyanin
MYPRIALPLPFLGLALAACSDPGGGAPDAAALDAPMPAVTAVTCPASPAATIVTTAGSFSPPSTMIGRGQIVKFQTMADHKVGPFPGGDLSVTDPALVVSELQTKCFRFDRTGTFKFICSVHFYLGTLTVN